MAAVTGVDYLPLPSTLLPPDMRLNDAFAKAVALSAMMALAACQGSSRPTNPEMAALPMMERVALGANQCWFKSKDPAFAAYRLAPELNSFSGRPRILIVRRNKPEARPHLVVHAQGNPAQIAAFGPLMNDPAMKRRINADVFYWARGASGCR